jgi:hypothetical protein
MVGKISLIKQKQPKTDSLKNQRQLKYKNGKANINEIKKILKAITFTPE